MIQAATMNIEPSFRKHSGYERPTLADWVAYSKAEVASKEKRLLSFYDRMGWEVPKLTYQYARFFKPDSYLRKNGYQPGILHELNIDLTLKALVESGILPERITVRIVNGKRRPIPAAHQSVRNLFNVGSIHDIDEDIPDTSSRHMLQWLNAAVTSGSYDIEEMAQHIQEVDILPDLQRAITFGRKARDENGNVIKIETHNGDPQVYFDALKKYWSTMFLKAVDTTHGLIDRYGAVPNIFTWERQRDYLDEKQDLFYLGRPLEKMKKEYPELEEAIDVINARMEIAYRSMRAIVSFHPDNPSERKTGNPATAKLEIEDFLQDAMKIRPYLLPDEDDLKMLLRNLEFVSGRRPDLKNLTNRLRRQLTEVMPELADQPPVPGLPLNLNNAATLVPRLP